VSPRTHAVAAELKLVIRLAARDPEALEGELPALCSFARVTSGAYLDEAARVHFILRKLIPEYLGRLPGGRDCMAIRELLTWEDGDGDARSLTTRYHKASAHLISAAADFGRRQEPRLLLECARRFIALDHEDREPAEPVAHRAGEEAFAPPAPAEAVASGIARVHKHLDYHLLTDLMADAENIVILNTWIPDLNILADALVEALMRGAYVSILMLYPDSHIARLRSQALQASAQANFRQDRVRPGVRQCLEVLAAMARVIDDEHSGRLRVRLYNSLPSIAVYSVDDRHFVSVFLHGPADVKTTQIEVEGNETLMGRLVYRELETLWEMGSQFRDVTRWQTELVDMRQWFGLPR
jgi:hypothetical protein